MSEHPTDDSGSSLWPTAMSYAHGETSRPPGQTKLDIAVLGRYRDKERYWPGDTASLWPTATVQHRAGSAAYGTESGRHSGMTLSDAVKGLWPTAVRGDADRGGRSNNMRGNPTLGSAVLYPTPSAHPYGSNRGGAAGREGPVRESLEGVAQWPTPQSRDENGPTGMAGRVESGGQRSSLSDAAMPGATRGRLNPQWVSCLMGFPSTWLDTPSPPVEAKIKKRGSRSARARGT